MGFKWVRSDVQIYYGLNGSSMYSEKEKILILAKTYPSPSAKHVETSCVAGINSEGTMRRIYPVPFRLIEDGKKFKKWQWIEAQVFKSNNDHRLESYKIQVDTIETKEWLDTKNVWALRRSWLEKIPASATFKDLEKQREANGITLALLTPHEITELEITPAKNTDWTEDERLKLIQAQSQMSILDTNELITPENILRKIPYNFHYHYTCKDGIGTSSHRHKLVDWEIGALYWNCVKGYRDGWEKPFRDKLEGIMRENDTKFLFGNQHRFPKQWLIVSLIYPPRIDQQANPQLNLF